MTFKTASRLAKGRAGFTLAEVLAAMMFMAIVIPVVLEGLHVASLAGEVAQRKMVAARLGNKVLNELRVTGLLQNSSQSGVVQDGGISYRWNVKSEPWTGDPLSQMTLATLTVSFSAQGKNYGVNLSTLVPPQSQL